MKYCSHCGAEIHEEAEICVHCGCRVAPPKYANNNQTLGNVAKIFMVISQCLSVFYALILVILVVLSFTTTYAVVGEYEGSGFVLGVAMLFVYLALALLPLSWGIPMTVTLWRKLKNNEPISIAFKICTLLFVNTVSGILLLCMSEQPVSET